MEKQAVNKRLGKYGKDRTLSKLFRVTPELEKELIELSSSLGISQTEVVEKLIKREYKRVVLGSGS
ncbi:hypothetical protein CMU19_04325 [Elizabethkingia anophelis]|nr:hypothetical protein [Elizabethkingia anophelis]